MDPTGASSAETALPTEHRTAGDQPDLSAAEPDAPGRGLRILIIDDDRITLALIENMTRQLGFESRCAMQGEVALALLAEFAPNIVLTDLRMPGLDGAGVLRRVKHDNPAVPVVIMSVVDSLEEAVTLVKAGADDFLAKPIALPLLAARLRRLIDNIVMQRKVEQLRGLVENAFDMGPDFVLGPSQSMLRLVAQIPAIAQSDATVLIEGETGTGKELIARAIHRSSRRARGPMICVNCASVPEGLWEREFFGHVRGAFTDAHEGAPGIIRAADKGTLFLDEVGEIPPAAQAKLLRFLQEKEYRPVGSTHSTSADVRLIAATNRGLHEQVQAGTFRQDLYYRLNVIPVRVPPLRERKEDVPCLADFFLRRQMAEVGKEVFGFSTLALQKLCAHDYPGNVRELENLVQRALISSPVSVICPGAIRLDANASDCQSTGLLDAHCECCPSRCEAVARVAAEPIRGPAPCHVRTDLPYHEARQLALGAFERQYVATVLRQHHGNVSRAAQAMQITRKSLSRVMARHGLGGGLDGRGGRPGRPRRAV